MIKKDVELTINKDGTKATLAKPLQLHKGDAHVCLDFHILGIDYDFHDLVVDDAEEIVSTTVMAEINILKPDSTEMVRTAEVLEGNIIHFVVEPSLLDERAEIGIHLIQIVICYGLTSRLALPTIQMTVKDRFDLDTINTLPVTPQIVSEIKKIVANEMLTVKGNLEAHRDDIAKNKEAIARKANADHNHNDVYNKKSEKIAVEQLPEETIATLAKVRDIRFVDQLPPKEEQEKDVIYFVVG